MQRVHKKARRERGPRLKLYCVSRDYSFNISEEFTRAAQLPMDRTEIKFGKQQQSLRLPKTCSRSRALRKQPIPSRLFAIQVEVTLAPVLIQGRWCYERLLRKKNCHTSVINSWITIFWIAFFRLVWNKPSACFQLLESCVIIVSFTLISNEFISKTS